VPNGTKPARSDKEEIPSGMTGLYKLSTNYLSNMKFNWSIFISSVLVIISWVITYITTYRHNLKSKQKEIITNYLIEAYRNIEDGCGRNLTDEQKRKMEKAIADIQLFGSPEQITAAKKFVAQMNNKSHDDPRILLITLRNDLRKELGLKVAATNYDDIIHWRLQ
jgi:hypothetical protein